MSSRLPYNEIGSGTGKLRRKCPAAVRALAVGMALGRKAGLCAVEYMRRERTGDVPELADYDAGTIGRCRFHLVSASTVRGSSTRASRFPSANADGACSRRLLPPSWVLMWKEISQRVSSFDRAGTSLLSLAPTGSKLFRLVLDVKYSRGIYRGVMEFDSAIDIFRHLKATGG